MHASMPTSRALQRALGRVLIVAALCVSDAGAQSNVLDALGSDPEVRVRQVEALVRRVAQQASQAANASELAFVEGHVAYHKQAATTLQRRMASALQSWTRCRNSINAYDQRLAQSTAAIATERSRISTSFASPEESALEGVIAQTKAELAGLEGRQQRVPLLEEKLRAMPVTGYMDAAPREALEAELVSARANLPAPAEIEKARRDLKEYEAQLQSGRANRATPDRSELMRLERHHGTLERDRLVDVRCAEREKKEFIRVRAQALGFVELVDWLDAIIDGRRQALAQQTGVPAALNHCATMQGPFRCTGAFDGSWNSRCTTQTATNDSQGVAKVTFGPDGWVEVWMTSAQQGVQPTILGGRISAEGIVVVDRNSPGQTERYRGEFRLVTSPLASGAAKPIGGGTYENVVRTANGQEIMRCAGTMKLH